MANVTASLVWYCKTPIGWRRYPVVTARNGRVKKGAALVGGKEQRHPDGHFEVRYYEGGKVRYKNVGLDPTEAANECDKMRNLLSVRDSAEAAGVAIMEEPGRVNLRKQVVRWIAEANDRQATEAAEVNQRAVDEFLTVAGKSFLDQVTADDIRVYWRALRARGCEERTVHNRHNQIASFLKYCGLSVARELGLQAPKFEKKLPDIYAPAEITSLLAACKRPYHRLVFSILWKTGLRDQEAQHLSWADIDWDQKVLTVRGKPQWGFAIKDHEQRQVPIPDDLLMELRAWREKNPATNFVLGTSTDRPNDKWLHPLKTTARAAGLNCGHCEGCVERNECRHFTLHGFRRTYATTLLRGGVDLRTVQRLMGHSDLASTMRYLTPASGSEVQGAVNRIFGCPA